jgi:lysophospholipase L1-like esterase
MGKRALFGSVLGAAVLSIAACGGGGGGGGEPSQSNLNTQTEQKTVVIDAQGDSTMWGYQKINGVVGRTSAPVPALLQSALQAQYGSAVTVNDNAISGTTLGQRMNGQAGFTPYAQEVTTYKANIVIENFAINDSLTWNSESPADFQNYLVSFIAASQAAGRVVVLEEPNPMADPAYNAALALRVQVIDDVAKQMNLPLVKQFDYIQSLPNWKTLLTDGVHPTDALYAIKAQRELDVVGPIVKSLQ